VGLEKLESTEATGKVNWENCERERARAGLESPVSTEANGKGYEWNKVKIECVE
jgi:hypothetical protein